SQDEAHASGGRPPSSSLPGETSGVVDELPRAPEKAGISGFAYLGPRVGAVVERPADQRRPLRVKGVKSPFAGSSLRPDLADRQGLQDPGVREHGNCKRSAVDRVG